MAKYDTQIKALQGRISVDNVAFFEFDKADLNDTDKAKLIVWPDFLQFPADDLLRGRPTLIVDDIWASGRTITAVKNRVSAAGGFPETCVLHFNPYRNLFGTVRPDYYAAVTDAYVIYPWEIDRGVDRILLGNNP